MSTGQLSDTLTRQYYNDFNEEHATITTTFSLVAQLSTNYVMTSDIVPHLPGDLAFVRKTLPKVRPLR